VNERGVLATVKHQIIGLLHDRFPEQTALLSEIDIAEFVYKSMEAARAVRIDEATLIKWWWCNSVVWWAQPTLLFGIRQFVGWTMPILYLRRYLPGDNRITTPSIKRFVNALSICRIWKKLKYFAQG